jgi:hypothetical protein
VFDRISGLPAHPLIVHAAVVFVPLLALGAILYAVLPMLRGQLRWPVGLLAVVGPLAITAARLSGENFSKNKNVQSPQMQALIAVHQGYGDKAQLYTIALGVIMLIFVFLVGPSRPAPAQPPSGSDGGGGVATATLTATRTTPLVLQIVLAVLAVAGALVTAYYVYKVGDSGAHMAWGGY